MKIAIFGLGYVGAVNLACLAKLGHEVIGVDIDKSKVEKINSGKSPISEQGLEELISKHVGKNARATTDLKEALEKSEIGFVCVGTPINEKGLTNTSFVEKVCKEISENVNKEYILCIRSTIPPGTIENLKKIVNNDSISLVSNPEFLREGNAIDDFFDPNIIVLGSDREEIAERVSHVSSDILAKVFKTDVKTAEMIKYVNNSWHALKIDFTNEIASIASSLGADVDKLIEIFIADKRLNVSEKYHRPGFAYGGSCLTKDPNSLKTMANMNELTLPIINNLENSNEEHIKRAIQKIKNFEKKKIGFLGISFKFDGTSDDMRESPSIKIIKSLEEETMLIYEPMLSEENFEKETGLSKNLLRKKIEEVIESSELLVIGPSYPEFKDILPNINDEKIILDLNSSFSNLKNKKNYHTLFS